MILRKIKKGDKVLLKGESSPLTVKDIIIEDVKVTRVLTVPFTRLYFKEYHAPVYSWKVVEIL